MAGLLLLGGGILFSRGIFNDGSKIEVLEDPLEISTTTQEIVVEIAGAVEKPGVYKLPDGNRIEDLLIAAGGISADADRAWIERTVNLAAKLADGQKIYMISLTASRTASATRLEEDRQVYS